MFTYPCLKCKTPYQSQEEEAYLCSTCLEAKNLAAKELDAKFDTRGQQPSSALADYDRACAGRKFPRAADIGIKI